MCVCVCVCVCLSVCLPAILSGAFPDARTQPLTPL